MPVIIGTLSGTLSSMASMILFSFSYRISCGVFVTYFSSGFFWNTRLLHGIKYPALYSIFHLSELRENQEYSKILEKTIMIRIKSEYTLLAIRPELLSMSYLKNIEKIDDDKARIISRASNVNEKYYPGLYQPDIPPEALKVDTCDILLGYFKGFENQIKKLEYKNNEELCEELLPLAIAF